MPELHILVLGAGSAGLKAAARARRRLPQATVTVIERQPELCQSTCGLLAYLAGDVESLSVLQQTSYGARRDTAFFQQTKDLDILTGWRIVALDRDERAVTIERTADGSERTMLMYDKLVYALGARPLVPPSVELGPAVMTVTAPEPVQRLRDGLKSGAIAGAAVLGGGCAGVEVAAALSDLWDCEVTLFEAEDHLLPRLLDQELSRLVAAELARAGVQVRTGCAVLAAGTVDARAVVTTSTGPLAFDAAVAALGRVPRTELARSAGLVVGDLSGLVVDANLRTSDPDVLAVGDCIELVHHTSGEICRLPLGSLASRQGRIAGDVLAGDGSEFPAVVGSQALRVLGLNVATTGLTAAAAQAAGLDPVTAWGSFDDRSHFHPDRALIHLALVYESGSDRLLGLQAVGAGDVVKRVDVFASLLRQDADLADILDAEFCFSPPYNAPLDPLHDLAAAALNARASGLHQVLIDTGAAASDRLVLDVRTEAEFAASSAALPPGTLNIPVAELRDRATEIPSARPLLVACAKGSRSCEAGRILQEHGFADIVYLAGGFALHGEGQAPAAR